MPKKKKKMSLEEILAPERNARAAMGEEKWAIYVAESRAHTAQILAKQRRSFDEFTQSPEPAARDALKQGLNQLKADLIINKSETCIEVLDAFIYCVERMWGASDSEAMLRPIYDVFQQFNRQEIAKYLRPGAKSAFKEAITEVMRKNKSDGQVFKSFMQNWSLGHLSGFTVESIGDGKRYRITDENGVLGEKEYSWITLEKMYSGR